MKESYSTITLTATIFGGHIVTEQYNKQTLSAAMEYFELKLAQMKKDNRAPDGSFYKYHPDAVWCYSSIVCTV